MKKMLLPGLLLSSVMLAGCAGSTSTPTPTTQVQQQKVGDTIKTGKILKLGEKYAIQETGKQPADLDSYGVDLSGYVGQQVQVTGQYSGDTLFVSKVEVVQ